jgi:hypothetical protein
VGADAEKTDRRFGRRITVALGATLGVVILATLINLIGIALAGSIGAWSEWLHQHRGYLLLWRLCLYGAVTYAWWRMRRHFQFADDGADTRVRLRRVEVAAACTIVVLETVTWFQHA